MFINPKNLVKHTFPSVNLTNFRAGSKIHCNNLSVEFEVDNIHYVMRMIHIASSNMFRNLVHSNIQEWLSQFLQLQEAFDFQDNPLQKHLLIGSKNFEDNFLVYQMVDNMQYEKLLEGCALSNIGHALEPRLVQLNKYETDPNFIQLNQNLTSDCCLLI